MKRTIINKMEDILEWHCDIIEYLPKNVLLKLYKDAKYICKYKRWRKKKWQNINVIYVDIFMMKKKKA